MKITFTTIQLAAALLLSQQAAAQETWIKVEAGTEFSIALKSDHSLWAWGNNANGQLGIGSTNSQADPVQIGTDTDWKSISTGAFHAVAIKNDGTLWAWGLNSVGQLGQGNATGQQNAPVQIGTDTNWKEVYAGQGHSIALKADSTIWGWGFNTNGQLGVGNTTNQTTPVQIGTQHNWIAVSCGGAHTLALASDHTLWTFGVNATGQLGDGSTTEHDSPVQIGMDTDWIEIAAGFEYSLGRKQDGTIWAWGFNGNGQLGVGNTSTSNVPVQIGNEQNWINIEAGSTFGFAINSDHALFSWGFNGNGQLGIGTTTQQASPVQVGTDLDWIDISGAAGAISGQAVYGMHVLGLHGDQYAICGTGANYAGQLGDNTTSQQDEFECVTGTLNLGVNEQTFLPDLIVTPNPSDGIFTVKIENQTNGKQTFRVVSTAGQLISTSEINQLQFDMNLSHLEKGVYMLVLENESGSLTKRVVIE